MALVVVGAIIAYISRSGERHGKDILDLYLNWREEFELPELSTNKKHAKENAKTLARVLKIVWNKKDIEEIELRHEIPHLTQADALAFVVEAESKFLARKNGRRKKEDGELGFVFDTQDARSGNLRLLAVEKESALYRDFALGQALIKMLRDHTPIEEFPQIAIGDGNAETMRDVESFVVAESGITTDASIVKEITDELTQKFDDEWAALLVSDDVIKFERVYPEPEEVIVQKAPSPFAIQKEAKQRLLEQKAIQEQAAEAERRLKWTESESEKRTRALAERDRAIAAGEINPLAARPVDLILQALEIAADQTGLFDFDDHVTVMRSDRIGSPTVFSLMSRTPVPESAERENFIKIILGIIIESLKGRWSVEVSPDGKMFTFTQEIR